MYKRFLLLCFFLFSLKSHAILIEVDVNQVVNNTYQATYKITNDKATSIEALTLYFQFGLFSNISIIQMPGDWDFFAADPDDFFGSSEPGFVDGLALATPLTGGQMLSGLVVSFEWLGAPGNLAFNQDIEIYDPNTFNVLDTSEFSVGQTAIPEPFNLSLLALGILLLAGFRITKQKGGL